jgi:hypothetical protein
LLQNGAENAKKDGVVILRESWDMSDADGNIYTQKKEQICYFIGLAFSLLLNC